MENTLENKAKFFAQYWGQIIVSFNADNLLTRGEVTPQRLNIVNIQYPMTKYVVLQLKPLSSITDEEAVEVAKILGLFEPLYVQRFDKDYIFIKQDENFSVDIWFSIEELDTTVKGINIEYSFAVDYLRSKGYALPWMGLSVEKLVEYGWVKLVDKKP